MLVYEYDGSLEGFYCCVFESFARRETPEAIAPEGEQGWLLPPRWIETDPAKAARVRGAVPAKISPEALELTETVFCSCLEQKEIRLLALLRRGFAQGARVLQGGMADAELAPLLQAQRHLLHEAHLLKGFVRFADIGGRLAATITPKNFILPFIAPHFILRYRNEEFLIFDKTHGAALIYEARRPRLVSAQGFEFPAFSEQELQYRALWKQFYHTIAIEGRENPRCRMTHMPKRYWENMVEMEGE